MTNIVALVRSWLIANLAVADLVEERISTVLDPEDGYPAIVIGATAGGPRTDASAGVDAVEDWSIALYCFGGRLAGGDADLPDNATAWAVAQAIGFATASITSEHYITNDAAIVSARIVSSSPSGVDPDTGSARATVTLALQVWR